MKKGVFPTILSVVFSVIFLFSVQTSSAFWVWTPGDQLPENPKHAPKDTPQEQYNWGTQFFEKQDFKRSEQEFARLVAKYPDSDLAPEAQYYAGRSFEELGKYYFAFEHYQKTVDSYPHTRRMIEIIEREYNIAKIYQAKDAPRLMNIELNISLDRAIVIYKKVIDNSPFGEYADKSYFNMAKCYRRARKYNEAVDAYDRLINDYPQSPLVEESKYELASTMYEASLDPEYDQESTDEALRKFERIARTTSIPSIAKEADQAITVLKSRKADSIVKIAEFYAKQGKTNSAVIYYRDVIEKYPSSDAAKISKQRIEQIEGRAKK